MTATRPRDRFGLWLAGTLDPDEDDNCEVHPRDGFRAAPLGIIESGPVAPQLEDAPVDNGPRLPAPNQHQAAPAGLPPVDRAAQFAERLHESMRRSQASGGDSWDPVAP